MNVVDGIVSALEAEGVRFMACLPDEVTLFLAQAFMDGGGRVFRARHEENAALAADGYARASGSIGVCVVGSGPALAHTATALVTASKKRSPVLMLVGRRAIDVPRGDTKEFDARRFAESAGATFFSMRTVGTLAKDLRQAFHAVRLRRGPVVLEVPDRDTLLSPLNGPFEYQPTAAGAQFPVRVAPEPEVVEEIAALLLHARRPVLFAGRGAVESEAGSAIEQLADRVGALLATSLQAREYFNSHPRNLGILGSFAREGVGDLLVQADLVVVLGASLNHHQTGGGRLAPDARVVQIDSDPMNIGRHLPVDIGVVGDARTVVRAILAALEGGDLSREESAWMTPKVASRLEVARQRPRPAEVTAGERLPATVALAALDDVLPRDRLVVLDGGFQMFYVVDQISVPDPRSWVWTVDFGSIGLSLGMAMGAALARPDRHCAVFVGDGGLAMNMQELETLARERVPLTVVVVNDAAYAAEVAYAEAFGIAPDLAEFPDIDFADVANALGIPACTVSSLDDLAPVARLIEGRDGPVLIDLKVTENEPHRLREAFVGAAPR